MDLTDASASHSPEDSSQTTAATNNNTKPKRVSTACEFCRKRKKKCDFRYPNCSACTRAGVVCTVLTLGQPVSSQGVPRDQIENLQKRVEWLEQLLRTKTGIDVSDRPTGSVVDDDEQSLDSWYQVPHLMAQPRAGIGPSAQEDANDGSNASGETITLPPLDSETLPNITELFRDKLENRRHPLARPRPSIIPPVRLFTSWEEAEQLVEEYFEGIGVQYPFLNRTEFMRNMRRIYQGQPVSPEAQNSYHITMAIAILTTTSDSSKATAFYALARETLAPTLQNEDLIALQALLSMALYSVSSPSGPNLWQIIGAAMRLATSRGLHKKRPSPTTTKGMVEDEMAKRAFWSLYVLDRATSVTLFRPLGIADEDITVDLPRELDENWVEAPGACQMSIFIQVIQVRRILSRIYRCCEYYRLRMDGSCIKANVSRKVYTPQCQPGSDIKMILDGFRRELDEWRMSAPFIPSSLLYSTSYYDFLYHTTMLHLYRPSSLNPTPDETCIVGCGDSSVHVIESYWENYAAGKIKWVWATLCYIYSAGVTILWCLEQNVRAIRQGRPPLWDNPHAVQTIDATLMLLEQFASNRSGADRFVSQFRRQSAQVLERVAQVQASMEQQNCQNMTEPVITTPPMDPMFMDQILYSYNWVGQEVASFYAL